MEKLVSEIASAVREEMAECIGQGMGCMYWEKEYGLATVCVEVKEVLLRNGMMIDDVDAWVQHDDCTHQSPLLENEIRKALPDWFKVKSEVGRQIA